MTHDRDKAFTLIELMISVAAIGILISIMTVAYTTVQKKVRDNRRKADLKSVQKAMEQYYTEHNGKYALDMTELTATARYLPNGEPLDPKKYINYIYPDAPWDGTFYRVCADLEHDGVFDGTNLDFCVISLQ